MMKKLLLLAFAVAAFAACSEEKEPPVTPPPGPGVVTGLTLDRKTANIAPVETLQLVATIIPSGVEGTVTWSSNDPAVATVSDAGLITAVAPGTATVTALCGDFSDKCIVTVAALPDPTEVISFETAENMLGIDGEAVALRTITVVNGKNSAQYNNVYWAKEFTEANDMRDDYDQLFFAAPLFSTTGGDTWFSSYYCDCTTFGDQYDAWGGFILSSNVNKTVSSTQAGMENQFEAYADGGANGSKMFAVCYDVKAAGMAMSADCCWPQIDFTSNTREVLSVCLANSTWTYNYFKGDAGDKYAVKVTGFKGEVETGNMECLLIDGATKVDGWKTFDISALGEVDRLTFLVVCSDKMAPVYFCMDDIKLKK